MKEFGQVDLEVLQQQLSDVRTQRRTLRVQLAAHQLTHVRGLRENRKRLARLLTALRQKKNVKLLSS